MRLLVIEDEQKIALLLQKGLKAENYIVDIALNGEDGQYLALTNEYDLIILDWVLPKKSGLEVMNYIREEGCVLPILMLTAMDSIEHKVEGLNRGADDYLVKPFAFEELLARIRSLLRRNTSIKDTVLCVDDLSLNIDTHEVKRGNKHIELTTKEISLLEYLLRNKNKVISRTQIFEHVWDFYENKNSNIVDAYICYLRAKIDKNHTRPLICTLRGRGYMLISHD